MNEAVAWTQEEVEVIRTNVDKMSDEKIGLLLNRTKNSVAKKRRRENIQRKQVYMLDKRLGVAKKWYPIDDYPEHWRDMILRKVRLSA